MIQLFVILSAIIFSSIAHAGGSEGHGALFRPVNSEGKPIHIQFVRSHPEQDDLMEQIRNVELPKQLKNELLEDLRVTQPIISNASLTYEQATRYMFMELDRVSKRNITLPDGTNIKDVTEEWVNTNLGSEFGVILETINIQVKNVLKTYLAAYTRPYQSNDSNGREKYVVYFSNALEQMSYDERRELVLHEQAHRIKFLHPKGKKEDFVIAWAKALLNYIDGKMSKNDFYDTVLRANNLPSVTNSELIPTSEDLFYLENSGGTNIQRLSFIYVTPEDILFEDDHGRRYSRVQFRTTVFKDDPIIEGMKDYWTVYFPEEFWNYYRDKIEKLRNASHPKPPVKVPVSIVFNTNVLKDSNGLEYKKFEVKEVYFRYHDLVHEIQKLSDQAFSPFFVDKTLFYYQWGSFYKPEQANWALTMVQRAAKAFSQFLAHQPELKTLFQKVGQAKISITENEMNVEWKQEHKASFPKFERAQVSLDLKIPAYDNGVLQKWTEKKLLERLNSHTKLKPNSPNAYHMTSLRHDYFDRIAEPYLININATQEFELNTNMVKSNVMAFTFESLIEQLDSGGAKTRLNCLAKKLGGLNVNIQKTKEPLASTSWEPGQNWQLNINFGSNLNSKAPQVFPKLFANLTTTGGVHKDKPQCSSISLSADNQLKVKKASCRNLKKAQRQALVAAIKACSSN